MEQNKDQSGAAVRGEAVADINFLCSTMDAQIWATEFCKLNNASDHGMMLGWFANAIMAGFDEATRRSARAADALDSQPSTDEPTDREALIACLGDDAVTLLRANPDDEMAQTMREAAAMLENDGKALDSQPTVSDGWISVKDRLPELGQTVLAVNNEYGQRESKFDRWSQGSINRANYGEEAGYFNWQEPMNNWGSSWKPTHWMPLPPAPASSQPTDGGVRNG